MINIKLDRNDLLDSIAQERTENAEVPELESAFYEYQYEKLDKYSDKELQEIYNDMFDEEE